MVDDMIVKTTRELKRLAKRIAQATKQASKLKQPCELVDEYITSWKDERASYLKVLTGLKATRTAVLAVVVPGVPGDPTKHGALPPGGGCPASGRDRRRALQGFGQAAAQVVRL